MEVTLSDRMRKLLANPEERRKFQDWIGKSTIGEWMKEAKTPEDAAALRNYFLQETPR